MMRRHHPNHWHCLCQLKSTESLKSTGPNCPTWRVLMRKKMQLWQFWIFFRSATLCNLEKCGCCDRTLWRCQAVLCCERTMCQAGYLWNLQRFQMGENSVPGAILDYNHKPAAVTEAGKPLPTLLAVSANIISNAGSTLRCAVNSPLHCRNTKKSTLHCRNTKKSSLHRRNTKKRVLSNCRNTTNCISLQKSSIAMEKCVIDGILRTRQAAAISCHYPAVVRD